MTKETSDQSLRKHLLYLLRGGGAHISFDDFIESFPAQKCGQRIERLPYTAWQVLEHMRIAQWDILEFSRNPQHVSPDFPKGYWPPADQPGDPKVWASTIAKFRSDLKEMEQLVSDPATDLFAEISHGDGQTILREVLLTADHNAYHLGALAVMGRVVKEGSS